MPSSSLNRDRRRQEERDKQLSTEADASMASITARLSTWTSDRVGRLPATSPRFFNPQQGQADEVRWMKKILDRDEQHDHGGDDDDDNEFADDDIMDISSPRHASSIFPATPIPQQKQKQKQKQLGGDSNRLGMDRADTPVHSNAKKSPEEEGGVGVLDRYSSLRKKKPLETSDSDVDATPSPNIHTPAPRRSTTASKALVVRRLQTPRSVRRLPPNILTVEDRREVQLCQQYHDALLQYLQSKRRWLDRHDLASTSAIMEIGGDQDTANLLSNEHCRIQVDFLQSLAALCYEDYASHHAFVEKNSSKNTKREANFWNLLAHLRRLGMDALLWHHHDMAVQYMTEMEELIQQQQRTEDTMTPLEILQSLHRFRDDSGAEGGATISIIQRRYQLLTWLEDCFRQQVSFPLKNYRDVNDILKPVDIANIPYKRDSKLYAQQGLPETEKDATLMRQSLELVLAGQLSRAQDLMRTNGLSWRAAVWGGGKPSGYEVQTNPLDGTRSKVRVGNPNRALWQSMLWRKVQESETMTHEERAIASLLCNNVKASFENPCMRSWEKALYAFVKAMVGRMEDSLLYYSQQSTDKFARIHLDATADMADIDEAELINHLLAAPYPEIQPEANDLFTTATAAFVIGRNGVEALLRDMGENLHSGWDDTNVMLRFATHLVLYLDSTTVDPASRTVTAPLQWDLKKIKNRIVVDYLQSLADRELWNLMVLYASLLPPEVMLHHLPPLLALVVNENDRRTIVSLLREIEPKKEVEILRAIVSQLEYAPLPRLDSDEVMQEAIVEEEAEDRAEKDDRMMKALTWFCISDDHALDALAYSNRMIRKFLLEERIDKIMYFVKHVRPENLLAKLDKQREGEDQDMPYEAEQKALDEVLSEYTAFELYLEAERIVNQWDECIEKFNAAAEAGAFKTEQNMKNWDETERSIAASEERRQLVEHKRNMSDQVTLAAQAAHDALVAVLTHEGGWLWQDGSDPGDGNDNDSEEDEGDEDHRARVERQALRKKVLPKVVLLHGTVCQKTAAWMEESLQHMASHMSSPDSSESTRAALMLLDPLMTPSAGDENIRISNSTFSPTYWTRMAMELADTMASDIYKIPADEEALGQMAMLTILHLQYSADLQEESEL